RASVDNFAGGALDGDGGKGNFARAIEPSVFRRMVALKGGMNMRPGAHHSRGDRCHINLVLREFSPDGVRKSSEGKLTGRIGDHVWNRAPSADGRNIDYTAATSRAHLLND